MDVDSFLGGLQTAVKPVPVSTEPPPVEPSDLTKDITPSGIEVAYQSRPKRLYKLRAVGDDREWKDIPEVPSVTTVLGLLHKPALTWWGMAKGVQGVLDLFDRGCLTTGMDWSSEQQYLAVPEGEDAIRADETAIINLLKEQRLTVNHRLDQASDRGINVHDAFETWARVGQRPIVSDFPESEQGYVKGLVAFLDDIEGDAEPERIEVMVGSVKYQYAGRFDLLLVAYKDIEIVERCFPKRDDKVGILPAGRHLIDLKTSRGCYDTHALQLAAYEWAAVECGYAPTDRRAVLRVDASGQYELRFAHADDGEFLDVRQAYDAIEGKKFFA